MRNIVLGVLLVSLGALSFEAAASELDELTLRVLDADEADESSLMRRITLPDPEQARVREQQRAEPDHEIGERLRERREDMAEQREAVREQSREHGERVREGGGAR
jgi:hypothetical protein